ncbi:MAG: MBL fold metallo-hydrolase [Candidatus Hydrothermarchaeales archaeon]
MRITLLGTGFAIPSKERVQSGILIETGELMLFDCGAGVLSRLSQSKYDHIDIDHVFFTHHHLDHNSDFLALLKANFLRGRTHLNVYGPIGTKEWIVGLLDAYPYLKGRFDLKIEEMDERKIELKVCTISCEKMKHSMPAIGYRIESEEESVVYTGDTMPCEAIKRLCRGKVKVLIQECAFPDPKEGEAQENHTTPKALGELIEGLDIEKLVITHFAPQAEGRQDEMVKSIKRRFKGEVVIAQDLLEIEV